MVSITFESAESNKEERKDASFCQEKLCSVQMKDKRDSNCNAGRESLYLVGLVKHVMHFLGQDLYVGRMFSKSELPHSTAIQSEVFIK